MIGPRLVFTANATVYDTDAIRYFDGYYSLAEYENSCVRPEYLHV